MATDDDNRWEAHNDRHDLAAQLRAETNELRWTAHIRAHEAALEAHRKEHALEATARDKAEAAIDRRLEGMNEVRSQLKEQAATFARIEVVQQLTDRVIAIEKLDIKGEGRSLGQGAVIATIVAAVGFAATLLGLIVVLANVLTSPS
jgi:hypothetical protein